MRIAVEKLGGECLKFVSPGKRGVPDRICLIPGGVAVFVEMKSSSGRLSPLQARWKSRFETLGFEVQVIHSEIGIQRFVSEHFAEQKRVDAK